MTSMPDTSAEDMFGSPEDDPGAPEPDVDTEGPDPESGVESDIESEDINRSVAQDFEQEFNISASELSTIDGFTDLSEGQQRLVLENLKQVTLGRIQKEGLQEYKQDKDEANFLSGLWKGITKQYQVAKQEKKQAKEIKQGGIDTHREVLQQLVNGTTETGISAEIIDGELKRDFVPNIDDPPANFDEVKEKFNNAANELADLPREWQFDTATPEQQEQVWEAQAEYDHWRRKLSDQLSALGLENNEVAQELNKIDEQLHYQRFLDTHPDVEGALQKLSNQSAIRNSIKDIATERGLITVGGYLTRAATTSIAGAIAAPAVSSLIGAYRGKQRAEETLEEREQMTRKGVEDESDVGKNFVKAESLVDKIDHLIDRIDEADDQEEINDLVTSLVAREKYTRQKMDEGLVNYGDESEQVTNKLDILQRLTRAEVYVQENMSEKLNKKMDKKWESSRMMYESELEERLDSYLETKEETISDKQKKYVMKKVAQGAAWGAGLSAAGYFAGYLQDYFSGEDESVTEQMREAAKKNDSKSPEGGWLPFGSSDAAVEDAGTAQADTADDASIAGGSTPDSVDAVDSDTLSQDADIAGGTSPEDSTTAEPDTLDQEANIAGGSSPDTASAASPDTLSQEDANIAGGSAPDSADAADADTPSKDADIAGGSPSDSTGVSEGEEAASTAGEAAPEDGRGSDYETNQQPYGGDTTETSSGAPGQGVDGGLENSDVPEETVGDDSSESADAEGVAGEEINQELAVDLVDEGDGLWSSAHDLVDQGEISEEQFNEAWSNEDSTVMIDGEPTHISKVDLVHEGDSLVFVPGEGDKAPHFELDSSSGYEPGTELPETETSSQYEPAGSGTEQATKGSEVIYGDGEGNVPLDTEGGKAPGIPNLQEVTQEAMYEEIDELLENADDHRAVFQDDEYIYGTAEITAANSDNLTQVDNMTAEMLAEYFRNHGISGYDPEALAESAEAIDANDSGIDDWRMIRVPKDELQIAEDRLATSKVDSAGFEANETPTLEEQLGKVVPETPEPPTGEEAQTPENGGGNTNAGVEGTNNQAGTTEAPQMTDMHKAGEAGQETADQASNQSADATPESAQTNEGAAEPTLNDGQSTDAENNIEVNTGEQALGLEPNDGETAGSFAERVLAEKAVSADNLREIVDLSERGLDTFPEDFARKLIVTKPEDLPAGTPEIPLSKSELMQLHDNVLTKGDEGLVSTIELMEEPDQIKDLHEMLSYYQENESVRKAVGVSTPPDENSLAALSEFVGQRYKEVTGVSIEDVNDTANQVGEQ